MLRTLTPAFLAALKSPHVRLRFFYEGGFKSGVVRWWTGIGPIEWNGYTWEGRGGVLKIDDLEETVDVKANGISITLSGVRTADVARALLEGQRSKTGHVWLALMYPDDGSGFEVVGDDSGIVGDTTSVVGYGFPDNRVIADPATIFYGRLDGMNIADGADTATISVSYVHHLQTFETPRTIRYTDEEQKRLHPGDKGLEFITKLVDMELPWGNR